MKKLFLLVLCLMMYACASREKYADKINAWIGQPVEQLVSMQGVPDGVYELDGKTYLSYQVSETVLHPGTRYISPEYKTYTCKTTYIVENKKIIKVSFIGNGCNSY